LKALAAEIVRRAAHHLLLAAPAYHEIGPPLAAAATLPLPPHFKQARGKRREKQEKEPFCGLSFLAPFSLTRLSTGTVACLY
jgi:hypothetical protein